MEWDFADDDDGMEQLMVEEASRYDIVDDFDVSMSDEQLLEALDQCNTEPCECNKFLFSRIGNLFLLYLNQSISAIERE